VKILLIDTCSNFLDFGMRCQIAGHDVLWWDRPRKDGTMRTAGKGIVPRLIDYPQIQTKWMDWADLIVTADNTHYLEMLDPWRAKGYPIFGPSYDAAKLELDRGHGQKVMKDAGLKVIPGITFHDYDLAARYVEQHPTFLVSKPSGDADKALSYVADDAASLVHMLIDRWKKNDKYRSDARKHGFILQEKIKGVEFAVGGWFGPAGWSRYWYENIENKKLMVGDLGVNTGEMGTVSMYVSKSKLADIALKPITKVLEKLEYVGFVDIAGMVEPSGDFRPFEFTMRPGWPTFHNQIATHEGDPAQWMLDLLLGTDTLQVKEDQVCVSVVMVTGDFPHSHLTNKEVSGIPIYNATDMEHVHLSEVMLADEVPVQIDDKIVRMPHYVTCGDYVAVVTGVGETITGARRSAYAAVKKVKMPTQAFYRTDIGNGRMVKGLPELQRHGFAMGFNY
jgi:phosphoribosylamine---glycine ligase